MTSIDTRLAIALFASAALAFGAACSDDDVDGNQNQNQHPEQDAGHDVEPDDAGNDLDAEEPETDVDTDADAEADTGDEDADAGEEPFEFDVDPVECAFPSDDPGCESGDFGPASFFKDFEIETEENSCCTDLTGDGVVNNYIGEEIVAAISENSPGFDDINQNILASIQSGELTYLMEAAHWEHPRWEADMDLHVYMGGTTEDSWEDQEAGEGAFNLSPANFDEQDEPKFGFESVHVRDGNMTARDGFIEVMFPGLVEAIAAQLGGVEINAEVVMEDPEPDLTAGGGFSLVNGELGGAILRDQFFKSMNEESLYCNCLQLDETDPEEADLWKDGLYTYIEGDGEWVDGEFVYDEGDNVSPGRWRCDWKAGGGDACEDPSEPVECRTLGNNNLCSTLDLFSNNTDVWIDGEPSFSIGVRFETVPVDILGIDPE